MPVKSENIRVPLGYGEGLVRSDTLNEEERTIEVIWSTGATVRRYSWAHGPYNEELSLDPDAVRMDRFDKGMSLLDTHRNWGMSNRLGTIVPGSARLENGKGYCRVKLVNSEAADALLRDLKDGHPFPVSVGYRVHKYLKEEEEGSALPTWRAIDWEPMEISAVPVPADAGSHSRSETQTDFECLLERNETAVTDTASDQEDDDMPTTRNENPADNNEASATITTGDEVRSTEDNGQPEGTSSPAPESIDTEAVARKAVENERKRANDIRALGRKHKATDEFIDDAIEKGRSVDDFGKGLLDHIAERSQEDSIAPFAPHAEPAGRQDEVETRREAVINALEHRIDPSSCELSDAGREYRGLSLKEVARDLLRAQGVNVVGMTPFEIAERSFHATSDFPIIMSAVTKNIVVRSYTSTPQTFRPFCRKVTATDFKDMNRITVGELGDLKKLTESGEYDYTTVGEGAMKWRIHTYGRAIGITRQTIINDDLGVFNNLGEKWGNAVSRRESKTVWDIIIENQKVGDNKPLFHADHNNYVTGNGTALAEESLNKAFIAMAEQAAEMIGDKDEDEQVDFLGLTPKFLLIPFQLGMTAQKLLGKYAPTKQDDIRPEYFSNIVPIVEQRLSKISPKTWTVVADPKQIDTIEYAYLEGNEGPHIESQLGFDIDGMKIKCRLDFGAAPIDHRGFYQGKGS